ncbi:hypothetical protein B1C78_08805 [Thioalkalivibrio denitrificans]|uniref:DUF268 domain-containing protein n=2 Tax=Thioalkalivibrio denitrificans TaxID=108003 RepID=A0A1V3NI42_9GAMM|nr:hypothetical protein B1C78_08805 [Thioalkalivibrio denitrificans]
MRRSRDSLQALLRCVMAIQINPYLIFRSLIALPRYIQARRIFLKSSRSRDWPMELYPVLLDWGDESANLGEYFWQDLYVAKRIIDEGPMRHVDVGSRVDGFIAHLACVRVVEIFDIRPLSSKIENVFFTQWDITKPHDDYIEISDCVSCLHTLEHLGLGRYGDGIDVEGWRKGLSSLASLVRSGGGLWLSVPVGAQRVEFNAHRVFAPATIRDEAIRHGLMISEFHYLQNQKLVRSESIEEDFMRLAGVRYALGIYHFRKI